MSTHANGTPTNGFGDDLAFTSALEQAELVRRRIVSPSELVEHALARIDVLNPQLDAFLTVAADQAREAARNAEARLLEGGELPPFLGVPISIKDLNETAGIRTTHATATWHDRVPDFDDEVVARIRRAGFVIIGKTNTPEFGSRSTTESPGYPTARNPWNLDRTPGGSSGGAGAAVAAGLGAIAQGSDGGGSIRIPAAWCGLYGIKPSRGRVSGAPGPQSWNATSGPIARTVADAAALLDVMEGYATGDAWWLAPPERPFVDEVGAPPGRLRIAWTDEHPDAALDVAPAWTDAVRATVELLAAAGHELVRADPPQLDLASFALIPASAGAGREDLPPLETLDVTNRVLVEVAAASTSIQLAQAMNALQLETRRAVAFFDDHDLLLTPTLAAGPPAIGEQILGGDDWDGMLRLLDLVAFTPTWNMTGQPAVAVPAGFDADGLPVSIQLVGRPADDATLIRVSSHLEQVRPWRDDRPPIATLAASVDAGARGAR
jgi:amidase